MFILNLHWAGKLHFSNIIRNKNKQALNEMLFPDILTSKNLIYEDFEMFKKLLWVKQKK
jgi:hypothetical protein